MARGSSARPAPGVLLAVVLGTALLCGAQAARQTVQFDEGLLTRMIRGVHKEIEEDPAATAAEAATAFLEQLGGSNGVSHGSSSSSSSSGPPARIVRSSSSSSSTSGSSRHHSSGTARVVARLEEEAAVRAVEAHKHLKKRQAAYRGDGSSHSKDAQQQQPQDQDKKQEQEKREREWSYWYGDGPNRGLASPGDNEHSHDQQQQQQQPSKGGKGGKGGKGSEEDKGFDEPEKDPYQDLDGSATIKPGPGYGYGWPSNPDPVDEQPAHGVSTGGCKPGVLVSSVMGSAVVLDNSIEVSKTPYKATADCMGEPKNIFQYGGACELSCTEPEDYGTLFNSLTSFTTGTEAQTVCGTLRFSKQDLKGICSLIPIAHCCEPATASTS